jgi:hypothetical protein
VGPLPSVHGYTATSSPAGVAAGAADGAADGAAGPATSRSSGAKGGARQLANQRRQAILHRREVVDSPLDGQSCTLGRSSERGKGNEIETCVVLVCLEERRDERFYAAAEKPQRKTPTRYSSSATRSDLHSSFKRLFITTLKTRYQQQWSGAYLKTVIFDLLPNLYL